MGKRKVPYSAAELRWIKAHKELPRRDAWRRFRKRFGRADASLAAYKKLCWRKRWMTGRDGWFPAGLVPHNKGKPMPASLRAHPNMAKTWFKPGHLPHNTKYAGHERVSKDGYVEISVNETNPYTGFERRHVLKHRWLWEQANGPIPEGMCLKCLDGNRKNTDPSNWEAIPKSLMPYLGARHGRGYDHADPALRPTILAVAKLAHAAARRAPTPDGGEEKDGS